MLARTLRVAVVLALGAAVLLAIVSPVAVPLAFGSQFREAVPLSELAILAGALSAVQFAVVRLLVADDRPRGVISSYAVTVGVMLAGDLALVPSFGAVGASWAYIVASGAGLVMAVRLLARPDDGQRQRHGTAPQRGQPFA